ncbi:MAG: exosortase N [Bacteroidota bacterium]
MRGLFVLLAIIGLIGAVIAFPLGYFANSNVIMGLALFPFALFIQGSRRNNFVYAGVAVFFSVIASIYGVYIFYFFAIAFYLLWLVEFFIGRLNILILFLIALMSPVFIQVVTILGFPIRLMLSEHAGSLLNLVGTNVRVEGNMMILNDMVFSVDEACMGLNMLATSMLMGVSVLVYRYRLSGKFLRFYPTLVFFGSVFILNMFTNLLRIMILVYFRVPPSDPMHEVIGLLGLVFYVVIPLYFFSGWFVNKYGKTVDVKDHEPVRKNIFVFVLPVIIVVTGFFFDRDKRAVTEPITKISTDRSLIYIKAIPEFFTGEHTPMMCWEGSGYKFSGITMTAINNVTIYKGTLVKDDNELQTAWWYSNGEINTISQLDWRMRTLRGEDKFSLVNVTANDEQTLMKEVEELLRKPFVKNISLTQTGHHPTRGQD